jgi:hypothetical protein
VPPTYDSHSIEDVRRWKYAKLITNLGNAVEVVCGTEAHRSSMTGLPVAARGGGHSVAGYSTIEGGLLLDLGPMKAIDVDPEARPVRVQPGVVWGSWTGRRSSMGWPLPGAG